MSSYEDALQEITSKKNVDLNLPNFTSTKYNKTYWRIIHFCTYFFFGIFYLLAEIKIFQNYKEIIFMIGSFSYLISSIIEWFHFRRGCCGNANLNNPVKGNIDEACYAKLKRSEIGLKYFLNIIITFTLLIVGIFEKLQLEKFKILHEPIIMSAMALLVISQLFKIERALTNTKQYNVKNDLSNSIVEILNFTGAMIYFTCYLLVFLNEYKLDKLSIYLIIGASFFVLSSFVLYYRYFHSGFDDLNISYSSFMTFMYE